MAIILRFTDWYILDPLLSIAISFFILSKALPRFLVYAQDFPRCSARRSRYPEDQDGFSRIDSVASINQLISGLWMVWKKCHCPCLFKEMEHMETCKESIRIFLKDCGFQNITIEVDVDLESHQAHKRKVVDLERSQSINIRKNDWVPSYLE